MVDVSVHKSSISAAQMRGRYFGSPGGSRRETDHKLFCGVGAAASRESAVSPQLDPVAAIAYARPECEVGVCCEGSGPGGPDGEEHVVRVLALASSALVVGWSLL